MLLERADEAHSQGALVYGDVQRSEDPQDTYNDCNYGAIN
jgi:hypothetical protein